MRLALLLVVIIASLSGCPVDKEGAFVPDRTEPDAETGDTGTETGTETGEDTDTIPDGPCGYPFSVEITSPHAGERASALGVLVGANFDVAGGGYEVDAITWQLFEEDGARTSLVSGAIQSGDTQGLVEVTVDLAAGPHRLVLVGTGGDRCEIEAAVDFTVNSAPRVELDPDVSTATSCTDFEMGFRVIDDDGVPAGRQLRVTYSDVDTPEIHGAFLIEADGTVTYPARRVYLSDTTLEYVVSYTDEDEAGGDLDTVEQTFSITMEANESPSITLDYPTANPVLYENTDGNTTAGDPTDFEVRVTVTDDCPEQPVSVDVLMDQAGGTATGADSDTVTVTETWSGSLWPDLGDNMEWSIVVTATDGDGTVATDRSATNIYAYEGMCTDDDGDGRVEGYADGSHCPQAAEYEGDCNDTDAAINPDAVDVCSSADEDCDGELNAVTGAEEGSSGSDVAATAVQIGTAAFDADGYSVDTATAIADMHEPGDEDWWWVGVASAGRDAVEANLTFEVDLPTTGSYFVGVYGETDTGTPLEYVTGPGTLTVSATGLTGDAETLFYLRVATETGAVSEWDAELCDGSGYTITVTEY